MYIVQVQPNIGRKGMESRYRNDSNKRRLIEIVAAAHKCYRTLKAAFYLFFKLLSHALPQNWCSF